MSKKYIPVVLLMLVILGCQKEQRFEKLNKAQWLLGHWENNSRAGRLVEEWTRFNDSTLIGYSVFVVGQDTVFSEDMQLRQTGPDLFFVAKVPGQNDDQAVAFKLTSAANDQLVFENPQHDFPKKIMYQRIGKDSLFAEVSGADKGQFKKETFRMRRK